MKVIQMDIKETIERMKNEILADMASGIVSVSCCSFAELHNYVDANCYGGFCDDDYLKKLWAFDGAFSDDGCPAEVYEYINNAQLAIDAWLHHRNTDMHN